VVSLPRDEAEPVYVELDDALVLHPELELHPLRSVTSEGVLALINDLLAEASVADATRPAAPNALGPVVLVRSDATPAAIDAMGLLTRLAKDMRALPLRWIVCGEGWRESAPVSDWTLATVLPIAEPPTLAPVEPEPRSTPIAPAVDEADEPDFLPGWEEDADALAAARSQKATLWKRVAIAFTLMLSAALGWAAFQQWPQALQALWPASDESREATAGAAGLSPLPAEGESSAHAGVASDTASPAQTSAASVATTALTNPVVAQTDAAVVDGAESSPASPPSDATPSAAVPPASPADAVVTARGEAAPAANNGLDATAAARSQAVELPPLGAATTAEPSVGSESAAPPTPEPASAQAASVNTESPVVQPPAPKTAATTPAKPAPVGQVWAKALPRGSWLVQFASFSKDEQVGQWLSAHPQIKGVRRVSAVKLDGSAHTVLVAGPYANREAANAAAQRAQPLDTWVRSAASLQRALPK